MGLALMDARLLLGLHRVPLVAGATLTLVILAVPVYLVLVEAAGLTGAVRASLLLYVAYSGVLFVTRLRADRKGADVVVPV